MNKNIYCRYAKTTYKKSPGFSITYAIVSLVVVAVVLAGLTPVLTRKLPNLSTSSIIKNPKGWYESFNAPISGKYCSKCKEEDEKYNDCLKEKEKNPNSNKECKDPWPDITIIYDKTITTNDQCFGNPACIPYINPNSPSEIVPFEQYCKSNGNCNPDPDTLKDVNEKLCYDANVNRLTGKLKDKLKPCPCPKGKCKFKPQPGITKYEVYAIGGGGGSGSAVASDPADKGNTYKDSVVGSAKNPLPKGNNLNNDLKKVENNPSKDSTNVTYIDDHKIQIANSSLYPKADFIDQSRIETDGNPYKPRHFSAFSGNANYPNILGNLNTKCATGIIYTIGNVDNNFHTYPTEDSNSVLAKSSTRQIKRILGNKEYLIGKRSVPYYNRYYLFTRYLGAYAYNQNPVYLLMPEWVKVDDNDKRYPNPNDSIDDAIELLDAEKIEDKDFITCDKQNKIASRNEKGIKITKDCYNISKFNAGEPKAPNGEKVYAIMTNYSTIAGVACSGDAGKGGNVYHDNTYKLCEWMWEKHCPFGGVSYESEKRDDIVNSRRPCKNSEAAPVCCANEDRDNSIEICEEDSNNECHKEYTCYYTTHYYNRVCKYRKKLNQYADCVCPDNPLENDNPGHCGNNDDIRNKCAPYSNWVKLTAQSTPEEIQAAEDYTKNNANSIVDVEHHAEYDRSDCIGKNKRCSSSLGQQGYATNFSNSEAISKILKEDNAFVDINMRSGGTVSICTRTRGHHYIAANGGKGAEGICTFVYRKINRDVIKLMETSGLAASLPDITEVSTSTKGIDRGDADSSSTYINTKYGKCSSFAAGATGGLGASLTESDLCLLPAPVANRPDKQSENGHTNGISPLGCNTKTGSYGKFAKSGDSGMSKSKDAKLDISSSSSSSDSGSDNNSSIRISSNGTRRYPGLYNYRYIWYMPFVTKHLMFGLAGEGGEEVHSLVTLSEGQTLDVTPGKGAVKTDHKSGANGGNGGQSEVRNDDANVKIIAHGGKGGLGSQKTDEYVLCHISDLQNQNPNLPCYYKGKDDNSFKSTHAREKDGKFVGILATQPKESTTVNSIKMSANLKQGTPGMGAMGFGTKSVSDVICENRHVTKWDEIDGDDRATDDKVIESGGTLYNVCRGNSKIKYIIPNGSEYTAGTGAVVVVW